MQKLFAIGTGPGNPDYLTLGAVKAIEKSSVIFAPNNNGKNMALDTAAEFIKNKKIILIDFPMLKVKKNHYENAVKLISKEIPEDGTGSFLTIGDPMIYSTFIYMRNLLKKENIQTEIISGIPSFVAAAGIAGIPITKKGEVFVLTDKLNENILQYADSIAHLKTFKGKTFILNKFEKKGFNPTYIEKATLKDQKIIIDKKEIEKIKDNYMSLILARKN